MKVLIPPNNKGIVNSPDNQESLDQMEIGNPQGNLQPARKSGIVNPQGNISIGADLLNPPSYSQPARKSGIVDLPGNQADNPTTQFTRQSSVVDRPEIQNS